MLRIRQFFFFIQGSGCDLHSSTTTSLPCGASLDILAPSHFPDYALYQVPACLVLAEWVGPLFARLPWEPLAFVSQGNPPSNFALSYLPREAQAPREAHTAPKGSGAGPSAWQGALESALVMAASCLPVFQG